MRRPAAPNGKTPNEILLWKENKVDRLIINIMKNVIFFSGAALSTKKMMQSGCDFIDFLALEIENNILYIIIY